MKVFLDFEASSLSDRSYPVEVAWVFQDGRSESHLIRPATEWTDWDDEAEAIHGTVKPTGQALDPRFRNGRFRRSGYADRAVSVAI
jgi:hypothetical protein